MNKIIFSGIQPTNKISIGNYFSIIKSLIKLQNNYKCLLMIADYHALASGVCKSELNKNVKNCIATCIASGMDPEKITIFKQSDIREHTELFWILSSITPINRLNNMTQFKNKKISKINLALYSYPILMTSDILLYNADKVLVG
jgi:tryptophanyl-tRNA synthetase